MSTVVLSAAGIGLTMPIIPQLMRDVGHATELGWKFGAFTCSYAPITVYLFTHPRRARRPLWPSADIAAVAGRYGGRLAMAPLLALLFAGRAIAGITGDSMVVTSAYIADVTLESSARVG